MQVTLILEKKSCAAKYKSIDNGWVFELNSSKDKQRSENMIRHDNWAAKRIAWRNLEREAKADGTEELIP